MTINQPLATNYEVILKQKIERYKNSLATYISHCNPRLYRSPTTHYRNRAEFRVWHEGGQCHLAMTDQQTRQLVRTDQFNLACRPINKLMKALLYMVNTIDRLRHKLFSIEFLTNEKGDAVVTLIYHRALDSHWHQAALELANQLSVGVTVHIVGRSRKQKIVVGADFVEATFITAGRPYRYCHIEGSFTQPNRHINQAMLSWVHEATQFGKGKIHSSDAMELYCGNGNFTLLLASNYRKVLATEISKAGIDALHWALDKNAIDNVKCVRLSAAEAGSALNKEREFRRLQQQQIELDDYQFSTVFVNPPRVGIDDKTLAFIQGFQRIVYISCNPESFAKNMQVLDSTHQITDFAWFDQFPCTEHIEVGAIIESR